MAAPRDPYEPPQSDVGVPAVERFRSTRRAWAGALLLAGGLGWVASLWSFEWLLVARKGDELARDALGDVAQLAFVGGMLLAALVLYPSGGLRRVLRGGVPVLAIGFALGVCLTIHESLWPLLAAAALLSGGAGALYLVPYQLVAQTRSGRGLLLGLVVACTNAGYEAGKALGSIASDLLTPPAAGGTNPVALLAGAAPGIVLALLAGWKLRREPVPEPDPSRSSGSLRIIGRLLASPGYYLLVAFALLYAVGWLRMIVVPMDRLSVAELDYLLDPRLFARTGFGICRGITDVALVVLPPLWGWLMDRFGKLRFVLPLMLVAAASPAVLQLIGSGFELASYAAYYTVLGLAGSAGSVIVALAVLERFDARTFFVAFALVSVVADVPREIANRWLEANRGTMPEWMLVTGCFALAAVVGVFVLRRRAPAQ